MKDNFEKYAVKHLGMSSNTLDSYVKKNGVFTAIQTPNVVEVSDSSKRQNLVNIFDRLMADKMIYLTNTVNDQMLNIISAQLQYLDTMDTNIPITFMCNSGGGACYSGLGIIDAMDLSITPIHTTCISMAASMMSVILSNGVKGERSITRHSRVMVHQSSGGVEGNIQSAIVAMEEWVRLNTQLFEILSKNTGKTVEQVKNDAKEDLWLNPIQALKYGIVDKIIWSKDKVITMDNLHEVE